MRRLIDIDPNDSVLDIIFETVMLVLFTLLGLIMATLMLGLIVFALYSIIEADM